MGFGKWLLGGACAVGAVIAAPVVLPAAGFAVMGSAVGATAVGATAGMAMMAGTSGAVAATAAAAGAAGLAVGAASEKKNDEAWSAGFKEGCAAASDIYEEKLRKQAEEFIKKERDWKLARDEYEQLIDQLTAYIQELAEKQGSDNDNLKQAEQQLNELYDLQLCS